MTKQELRKALAAVFKRAPRRVIDIGFFCRARGLQESVVRKHVHELVRDGFISWSRKWTRIERTRSKPYDALSANDGHDGQAV